MRHFLSHFFHFFFFLDSRPDLKRITQILLTMRITFQSLFFLEQQIARLYMRIIDTQYHDMTVNIFFEEDDLYSMYRLLYRRQ